MKFYNYIVYCVIKRRLVYDIVEMNKSQALAMLLLRRRTKKRRFGIHPINLARKKYGHFYTLMPALKRDEKLFFNYTRMDIKSFEKLLSLIESRFCCYFFKLYNLQPITYFSLEKTSRREPISPAERLMITLRFLATGDSYHSISYNFRVGVKTVIFIRN